MSEIPNMKITVSKVLLFCGFAASYFANSWPVTMCYVAVAVVYGVECLFEFKVKKQDEEIRGRLDALTSKVDQTQSLIGITKIGKS